jgi:hypothetical protein
MSGNFTFPFNGAGGAAQRGPLDPAGPQQGPRDPRQQGEQQPRVGQKRLRPDEAAPDRSAGTSHQGDHEEQRSASRLPPPPASVAAGLPVDQSGAQPANQTGLAPAAVRDPSFLRELMGRYMVKRTATYYKALSNAYNKHPYKGDDLEHTISQKWHEYFGPDAPIKVIGTNIENPYIRVELERAYMDLAWMVHIKEVPTGLLRKFPSGCRPVKSADRNVFKAAVLVFCATHKRDIIDDTAVSLKTYTDVENIRRRQVVLDVVDQDFIFAYAAMSTMVFGLKDAEATKLVEEFNKNYLSGDVESIRRKEELLACVSPEVRSAIDSRPGLTLTALLTQVAIIDPSQLDQILDLMEVHLSFSYSLVKNCTENLKSKGDMLRDLGAKLAAPRSPHMSLSPVDEGAHTGEVVNAEFAGQAEFGARVSRPIPVPHFLRQRLVKSQKTISKDYTALSNAYSKKPDSLSLEETIAQKWNMYFGAAVICDDISDKIKDPQYRSELEAAYIEKKWIKNITDVPTLAGGTVNGLKPADSRVKKVLLAAVFAYAMSQKKGISEEQACAAVLDKQTQNRRAQQLKSKPDDQALIDRLSKSGHEGSFSEVIVDLIVLEFRMYFKKGRGNEKRRSEFLHALRGQPQVVAALGVEDLTLARSLITIAKMDESQLPLFCDFLKENIGSQNYGVEEVDICLKALKSKGAMLRELEACRPVMLSAAPTWQVEAPSSSGVAKTGGPRVVARRPDALQIASLGAAPFAAPARSVLRHNVDGDEDQVLPAPTQPKPLLQPLPLAQPHTVLRPGQIHTEQPHFGDQPPVLTFGQHQEGLSLEALHAHMMGGSSLPLAAVLPPAAPVPAPVHAVQGTWQVPMPQALDFSMTFNGAHFSGSLTQTAAVPLLPDVTAAPAAPVAPNQLSAAAPPLEDSALVDDLGFETEIASQDFAAALEMEVAISKWAEQKDNPFLPDE